MANIDATLLRTLRSEIEAALATVGKKHNISFHVGSGHYAKTYGDLKLEITSLVGGQVVRKEETDFKTYASIYGLNPSDFGQKFRFRNDLIQITGLARNRKKFPIEGKNLRTGKTNLYVASDVVRNLVRAPQPVAPPVTLVDEGVDLGFPADEEREEVIAAMFRQGKAMNAPSSPSILLLTESNPYKVGTKAHATFELMRRTGTVSSFKAAAASDPMKYDASYLSWASKPHGNQPAYIMVG